MNNRSKHLLALLLGAPVTLGGTVISTAQAKEETAPGGATAASKLTPQQEMLWKYTARCALREDQELGAPAGLGGETVKFKGAMGLGPEWREGKCDRACQEKVSACLAALTNQTGLHVQLSMLSAAPSLAAMRANDSDLAFPFQEGAFFGNVFSGEANVGSGAAVYVCRGRDAEKGEQVKRFCALAPGLCSGIAQFNDAGRCEDSCEMSCTELSDGTNRCAAVRCRDPQGRTWDHPITTYLRNRIEAGNANTVEGAVVRDSGLQQVQEGARAVFQRVDFGSTPGAIRSVVANVAARKGGGRIEVWLDGRRRVGVLPIRATGGIATDLRAPLRTSGLSGTHDLVLRFAGLHADVDLRVTDIGLR